MAPSRRKRRIASRPAGPPTTAEQQPAEDRLLAEQEPALAAEDPGAPDVEPALAAEDPGAAEQEPALATEDPMEAEQQEPAATAENRLAERPEAEPGAGAGATTMPVSTRHAWRRLGRLIKPRISTGNLVVALLTIVVGFALVAQVQAAQDVGLEELRETDLVALLDDVSARAESLEDEIRLLEADREALQQGTGAEAAAAAEARLTSHQILAGTVPVEGPGITMTVSAPEGGFTPTMMIDLLQELRNAGAEAIQIGPVRVVASSWIGISDGVLTVDGQLVADPFRIVAIGDPHTLSGAMAIPGGFTDSVRGINGNVQVVEGELLVIDALHQAEEPQYARPVPSE
ncbi:DUF881 domain-containing protein [Ornithinimicrobium sp. F0845]|uniref:DUF881 domain-containing protein n=1 Tax=Ornithinimicrobium sp. F0845 TaxID=2926412 RepID=UPI001FF20FA8|nr:DUF881 domain-containing protein [Ornithinimicrobium sp. F0845]